MALVTLPDGRVVDVPDTGLIGSEQALKGGLTGALDALGSSAGVAGAELEPFATGGGQSFQLQLALSGSLGPDAQRQAFQDFQTGPGAQFAQEEGERAAIRNAAATGGLGGGNIRDELNRRAVGAFTQDFGNQFQRLGSLSQFGLSAAGDRAGIAERTGLSGAQAILGTGQDLSAGRTRVGEGIATAVSGTGSALADLIAAQGTGVSGRIEEGTGNIASLLAAGGANQAGSLEQFAALLANISTGAGSQVAGLSRLPGLTGKKGFIQGPGELGQGIEGLASAGKAAVAAFSDVRLKKNIEKIGKTSKGFNLYQWDWNEIGKKLTGELVGIGVMAHEVMKSMPEAVIDGEFLKVDYGKVL